MGDQLMMALLIGTQQAAQVILYQVILDTIWLNLSRELMLGKVFSFPENAYYYLPNSRTHRH